MICAAKNPHIVSSHRKTRFLLVISVESTVSAVAELHAAVRAAAMGETILITAGTYGLLEALWVIAPGVTVRGATSDGNDVILGVFTLYDPSTLTNQVYLPMLLRN
jgi:hypothetical protein